MEPGLLVVSVLNKLPAETAFNAKVSAGHAVIEG